MPKKKPDIMKQYIAAMKREWARRDKEMAEFVKRFKEKDK